ncbi:La-related protein 7, partial [Stegodyphus mimosarum]
MSKAEWKSYRNKYLTLQRATMAHLKKTIVSGIQELKEQEMSSKSVECNPDVPKKGFHFQPGVIIKVKLSEPVKTPSDIKDQVKANAVVAYIDAPLGHSEVFVRCHTSEEALSVINERKLQHLGTAELLKDTEEAEYWKKIESDRNTKFSTPVTHKKRGRDKIIAKA